MNRYKLFQAGVDVNEALERLGGDKALYEDLLAHFKESHRYEDLVKAMDNNDAAGAFQLAHALKGTAGNLSFTRLFEALLPVVEALRAGDVESAKTSLPEVEVAYQVLMEAI